MRIVLMATVSVLALCGSAFAGGDDHFGGSETSAHSSFGGTTGFGSSTSMSSAQDGYGGFTVDRLAQDDYTDQFGNHHIDTYSVDTWRGDATLVSHDVESGMDTYRVRDETVSGGYRTVRERSDQTVTAQTTTATTTTTTSVGPTDTSSSTDLGGVSSSLAGPAETTTTTTTQRVSDDQVTMQGPTTGSRLPGPVAYTDRQRATYGTLEQSLDALRDIMVDRRPGQTLNASERLAAALTNMGAFGALGAITGGKVHRGALGRIEGAILGAALAEARRQRAGGATPFDADIRDVLTVSDAEFNGMASQVRGLSPSQIDRFNRMVADVRRDYDTRSRQTEHEDRTGRPGHTGGGERRGHSVRE